MPRDKKSQSDGPVDNSMVLYTSMVLIILTFFIMITTKANFDETKYGKVLHSVTQTFGLLDGGESLMGEESGIPLEGPHLRDGLPVLPVQDREMNQLRAVLNPSIMDDQVRIVHNSGQRIISLSSGLVFPPDSAEITPEARELLLSFCRIMRDSNIPISIEGHTDNLPPQVEGVGDNWDLSLARALAVLALFVEEGELPIDTLSAYGYGGEKPLVANNSPANRAKNNRVDLVLDYEATRAGSLRGFGQEDRSYDFQGFQFELPEKPSEGEGEVY
ncbi:MAG: OmpA family protein [Deltaproteobacteria bacterium]|nr:OmpA family protein [Deltaproteobacteria bacterium]